LLFAAHPKTCTLNHKQRKEEDFLSHPTFWRFNLQIFQALKPKNNLKQAYSKMLIGIERRSFSLSEDFFSSISKHFKPQTLKATQTKLFKMQSQPFFFYHTTNKYLSHDRNNLG